MFFVVSYWRDGVESGAMAISSVRPVRARPGAGVVSVLVDAGSRNGVAVEGAAARADSGGGGESDRLTVVVDVGAGTFDAVKGAGGGYPVWASLISVSSWGEESLVSFGFGDPARFGVAGEKKNRIQNDPAWMLLRPPTPPLVFPGGTAHWHWSSTKTDKMNTATRWSATHVSRT